MKQKGGLQLAGERATPLDSEAHKQGQHGRLASSLPAMSVVVIAPDRYDTVGTVLRHLKAQSIQRELEVVLVAPAAGVIPLDAPELQGFHDVQVVPFAGILSSPAAARVAGVRAARAPVVAFVE